MDETISNTNNQETSLQKNVNENRILLILWTILLGLGYYIYMIWDYL